MDKLENIEIEDNIDNKDIRDIKDNTYISHLSLACKKSFIMTNAQKTFCDECSQCHDIQIYTFDDTQPTFYPSISKITDKIFLGNEDGGRDKEKLKELGITHILVCGTDKY